MIGVLHRPIGPGPSRFTRLAQPILEPTDAGLIILFAVTADVTSLIELMTQ